MKFTLRPTACLAATLVAILAAGCAIAQQTDAPKPTIAAEVYKVDGPFTTAQQESVEMFVDYYVERLINGSDDEVVAARSEIVGALSKGGTPQFAEQYAEIALERLAAANPMQSQRHPYPPDADEPDEQRGGVIVRLNTMITVSRLSKKDEHAVTLILTGTKDENPAVRYWAIRAVRGGTAGLSPDQQRQLREALQQMVGTEQADEVLRVLLTALIDLDAVDPVLASLNRLIALHIGKPQMPYSAKREAMQALLQKLLVWKAENRAVDQPARQFARAASRYMTLITQQAQNADLPPEVVADHIEMVRMCDSVLRRVPGILDANVNEPPQIAVDLNRQNWQALQVAALSWREALKQQPFNFTDVDLAPAGGN